MIASILHRGIVFPSVLRLLGAQDGYADARDDLSRLEAGTSEALGAWQAQRAVEAVERARSTTEFYASHWGPGDGPGSRVPALDGLPLLEKTHLQRSADGLRNRALNERITTKTTGGSTGQPVTLEKDRRALGREIGGQWHAYGWYGLRPGDRWIRLWGNPSVTRRRLKYRLADLATNRRTLSAFGFNRDTLARYDRDIRGSGATFLYGYVSMLRELAMHRRDAGTTGSAGSPLRAIVTTSEVLEEADRALIGEAFGVPVHNEYGCGEVGPIAYECERGTLHTLAANLIVEILTEDGHTAGPGESGEVVITDLSNRAMPLIRYRLGDWAEVASPCACGRALPGLRKVWGRAYDVITLSDGRRYHGEYFMYLAEDLRAAGVPIEQFQVTQLAEDLLQVAAVVPGEIAEPALAAIRHILADQLPGIRAEVIRVESIPREASGKMRLIRGIKPPGAYVRE